MDPPRLSTAKETWKRAKVSLALRDSGGSRPRPVGAAAVSEIEAREDRGYGGEAGAERDPVAPGSSSKNADAISISRGEDEEEEEEEERATPPASAQASRSSWRGREET